MTHVAFLRVSIAAALATLAFAGCQGVKVSQKTGSDVSQNDGKSSYVTYVTPEEYQRMTPAERERTHATVGVEASARLWGKEPSEAVSSSDLDKAMSNAGSSKK
ncbi:hypothetical protein DB347_19860 [Opitutaceae bacterium EW11]|nr:hypothetical protein DB347_19860 [Opitutaceae bacterium EW11]